MKRLIFILLASCGAIFSQQNALLLPWTPQQFTNTNGTVLANGKVCTYQAGTSTGLATYTDSTASVANNVPPNAILLDSTGRPTSGGIWLKSPLAYKIVVLTAGSDNTCNTGVTIKSQDQVITGSGAGLNLNNTFSGTNTFTGLIQCKNFESTRCVDSANSAGWAGADVCAWITSAQADLPANGGTIQVADGSYGACAGGFTLGSSTKSINLQLGATLGGNTGITVNAQILVACSNCRLLGIAGSATTIFQGASFPANTPVIQIATGGTSVTRATVERIRVNCNGVANSIGFEDAGGQDQSGFIDTTASNCTKYGHWWEGANVSNSIGINVWSLGQGAAVINVYIHNVNRFYGLNVNAVQNAGVGDPTTNDIVIDGSSGSIYTGHCEDATTCIDMGVTTASVFDVSNFSGHNSITNVVKIENTASNRITARTISSNAATNSILDSLNVVTLTDSFVPWYSTENVSAWYFSGGSRPTMLGNEVRWQNTARTIDGRCGVGSFSSTGFACGTTSNNIFDLAANGAIGSSIENNGTNSGLRIQNYTRVLETTATAGVAGSSIIYADSTAHNLKVNLNNTGSGPLVTAAPCTTSQRTETAADANLLTCAIPAQAGSYRLRFILSVSASNTATLGWTATWTNSNGAPETPTNMSLFVTGSGAPALTFTVNGGTDLYGYADVDVNNAGASIVVKLTFSGTSFTGKASATVERVI